MGWNCTLAVARSASIADLARLGWRATSETVSWDDAASSSYAGLAAWERDGDVVLASGELFLLDHVEALGSLGDGAAIGFFHSVTDTYVWETAGLLGRRTWQWAEGVEIGDDGAPHPAEAGRERLDEDVLFELLAAVGLVYDERLEEATMRVLDTAPPALDVTPEPRKRKRFGIF